MKGSRPDVDGSGGPAKRFAHGSRVAKPVARSCLFWLYFFMLEDLIALNLDSNVQIKPSFAGGAL